MTDNGESSYRRFLEGDENAFDDIFKLYRDGLTFFINRFVNNLTVSEDIAMDVFVDVLLHKKRYNFKVSLKTYLYMIGRSHALDYLKHSNIIKTEELEDNMFGEYDMESYILSKQLSHDINNVLKSLPNDMMTAVYLTYIEEMPYADVAKIMKKTSKQVDNILYRAKEKLRASKELEAMYNEQKNG